MKPENMNSSPCAKLITPVDLFTTTMPSAISA